jgi:hypothetical protein
MKYLQSLVIISSLFIMSCSTESTKQSSGLAPGSFGYDLNFLKKYDKDLVVLTNGDSSALVIVSARYQGKVFTSTAGGLSGRSFGWVNYQAFEGPLDAHMNAYGGENRLWLGPEGAQFSLFFKPGVAMTFENWHTPAAFDSEAWEVLAADGISLKMSKPMSLTNYAGTALNLKIDRTVRLLEASDIASQLGVSLNGVDVVGYSTENTLTNAGNITWTEKTGAPCIWMLDMFVPSPGVTVLVPYKENVGGKVATTDYFGQIPPDRVRYADGTLYFKADGKNRGKLGIPPQRAKPMAGSYDAVNKVLTLTVFDVDSKATYLNQEWKLVPDPLNGDAVNAYNDGPLEDGSQMGPFYELESVSPAAFLEPGQVMNHRHSVVHLMGSEADLDKIARATLGVSVVGL